MGRHFVCPRMFYQLFTINAFIHGKQFLLLYALLSAKTRAMYNRMITLFKESLQASGLQIINPQQILCDYELALYSTYRNAFPWCPSTWVIFSLCTVSLEKGTRIRSFKLMITRLMMISEPSFRKQQPCHLYRYHLLGLHGMLLKQLCLKMHVYKSILSTFDGNLARW